MSRNGHSAANMAINPSGGSGGLRDRRFLAVAELPWSFASKGNAGYIPFPTAKH